MITVDVNNQQARYEIEPHRLQQAVRTVLVGEQVPRATVSIAVVDDAAIHELNRRYLQHDYPTDVLSFLLEREGDSLEGEIIVSVETAARSGREYGCSTQRELLLYVIHGTLHLVGFDDHDARDLQRMRAGEQHYLRQIELRPAEPLPGHHAAERNRT